uniref:Rab-like protein 6 n=1 Tax=Macrostomum lignano TaxID=282301 RepID=A0A1I8IRQ1_9PLAT
LKVIVANKNDLQPEVSAEQLQNFASTFGCKQVFYVSAKTAGGPASGRPASSGGALRLDAAGGRRGSAGAGAGQLRQDGAEGEAGEKRQLKQQPAGMPRSPSGPEPKRPKKRHARRILRFLRGLFAASPTAPPEILASGLGGGGSGCGCGCCTGIGGSGCPAADGSGLGNAAGVPQIRVRVQLPPPQQLPQPPSASQCEHPCCLMHRQEGDEPASTSRWTDSRSPSPSHPQPETIDNVGNADGGASDDLEAAPGAFECPSIGRESTVSTTTLQPAEPPSTPRLSQMSKPIDNASSSTSASASASAARRLTTTTAALITPVRTASLQQAAALIGPPTDDVGAVRSCRLQPAPVSLRQVVTMSGGGGSCVESGAVASAERETPPKLTDGSTLPPAVSAARQLQLPKVQWLFQTSHSAAALPPQPTTRTADAAELDEPVANVETGRGGCRLLQLHRHQSAVASSASQRQTLLAASTPPQPQPPRQVKLRPLQLSELRPEVSTNHRLGDCCSSLRPSDGISDKQQPQQQQ